MSGADAAAYCGVTAATFARWISDGRVPKPLPGTRRWDRKAIDLALDRLSGISPARSRRMHGSSGNGNTTHAKWKSERAYAGTISE
jgi:hypothetical protein